jgi:Gluconate 2-dehydrogenase subunit 3
MSRSFRKSGRLPKRSGTGLPPDPEGLPRQRRGTAPQMRSRYPDYDVLDSVEHWDEATRRVVLARLDPPPIRFFHEAEARTLAAFCDTVTAQDDEPRIPVLAFIDQKLYEGRLDGYQYDHMPDDRDVWRIVARGLEEAATQRGLESFASARFDDRHAICEDFAGAKLEGGAWEELDVSRAWSVVMRGVLQGFYSHPWAWNEMGFGGPAYPRGYAALGVGHSEHWEADEAFDVDPVEDVQERGLE